MKKYSPTDATTNPSLILSEVAKGDNTNLLNQAIEYGMANGKTDKEIVSEAADALVVLFGVEILKVIPGRVSTEIDARLSFDREASIAKALKLIAMYEKMGVKRERILIKLASTWEGIQAARQVILFELISTKY